MMLLQSRAPCIAAIRYNLIMLHAVVIADSMLLLSLGLPVCLQLRMHMKKMSSFEVRVHRVVYI